MERNIYIGEDPQTMDWGEKKIVPLNVKREVTEVNGEQKVGYRADLVPKVKQPVTVDSIVEAAINSEYSEAEQKRIMRKLADENDEQVKKYKAFVAEITAAAKAAGYED